MRVWLPYVQGGSGTDTFTRSINRAFAALGASTDMRRFGHFFQYAPWILKAVRGPEQADVTLTNSWNGFAFKRAGVSMVAMEQLCVFDPDVEKYKTPAQRLFHNRMVRGFESRTFELADAVVAVSEWTARSVRAAFPGVEPLVIPNGADTEFFVPPPVRNQRGDGPYRLLFVGNVTVRKGSDLLPGIMEELGSDYVLRYTSGLRETGRLPVENSIPLGRLDAHGVLRECQTAHALLFPTRLEGLPLAVIEAMACGLPVIGSDRASMPEVVEDGVSGFLVPLEVPAFAAAVRRLEDEGLRQQLAENARLIAVERFSMSSVAATYLRLFRSLVPGGGD